MSDPQNVTDRGTEATPPERHLRWPAERFYWGVLDGSVLPPASPLTTVQRAGRLGYLFEPLVPGVTVEELHAVYKPLPGLGRRILACGLPRVAIEELTQGALTLAPTTLPKFVEPVAGGVDPASLNLLTGAYTPAPVGRLQRRWQAQVLVAVALCAVLIMVGAQRRVGAARRDRGDVEVAQMDVYRQVLGPEAMRPGALAPSLQLLAEKRTLETTRSDAAAPLDVDCATHMSRLLSVWPGDLDIQTESLIVAPDSIRLVAWVPGMVDAQTLTNALADLEGWTLLQPQTEVVRGKVRATMQLRPDRLEGLP